MENVVSHDDLNQINSKREIFLQIKDYSSLNKYLQIIQNAKIKLILDLPFFGYLLSHLKLIITEDVKLDKYAIDNDYIYFQKKYLERLGVSDWTTKKIRIDLIHLVLHYIYQHTERQKHYIPKIWSISADIVVYQALDLLLLEWSQFSEFRFHIATSINEKYLNQRTEKVYELIVADLDLDRYSTNVITKNTNDIEHEIMEKIFQNSNLLNDELCNLDHTVRIQEEDDISGQIASGLLNNLYAEFSKQGNLPNFIEEYLKAKYSSKINWRTQLTIYLQDIISNNTSWIHPNRKHIARGIYLPSQIKESLTVIIALDTSQSINNQTLSLFIGEIVSICNSIAHVKIILIQCDLTIQSIQEYDYGELPYLDVIKGRGGTDFRPVFQIIDKYQADLLIYFTDGEGIFPAKITTHKPVIWVLTSKQKVPFGQTVYI